MSYIFNRHNNKSNSDKKKQKNLLPRSGAEKPITNTTNNRSTMQDAPQTNHVNPRQTKSRGHGNAAEFLNRVMKPTNITQKPKKISHNVPSRIEDKKFGRGGSNIFSNVLETEKRKSNGRVSEMKSEEATNKAVVTKPNDLSETNAASKNLDQDSTRIIMPADSGINSASAYSGKLTQLPDTPKCFQPTIVNIFNPKNSKQINANVKDMLSRKNPEEMYIYDPLNDLDKPPLKRLPSDTVFVSGIMLEDSPLWQIELQEDYDYINKEPHDLRKENAMNLVLKEWEDSPLWPEGMVEASVVSDDSLEAESLIIRYLPDLDMYTSSPVKLMDSDKPKDPNQKTKVPATILSAYRNKLASKQAILKAKFEAAAKKGENTVRIHRKPKQDSNQKKHKSPVTTEEKPTLKKKTQAKKQSCFCCCFR